MNSPFQIPGTRGGLLISKNLDGEKVLKFSLQRLATFFHLFERQYFIIAYQCRFNALELHQNRPAKGLQSFNWKRGDSMFRPVSILVSVPIMVVGLLSASFWEQLSVAATLFGILAIVGFAVIATRLTEDHDVSD
jgi:hypothetical protein